MPGKPTEVILFSKCTGINDSTETTGPQHSVEGVTDLRDSLNVTTTPEGKLIKVPALTAVATASVENITDIVASNDFVYAHYNDGLFKLSGNVLTAVTNCPTLSDGVKVPYIKTPQDLRFSVGNSGYKIKTASSAVELLTIGDYTGPATSKQFSKMPVFTGGFVLGPKLYTKYGKFLQFSEDYFYDLFNAADSHIGSNYTVLQCGQIPGCIITTHAEGVTGYFGTGPHNFRKEFFPCKYIQGTLYSGNINKLEAKAHVFMCADGFYALTADGKLTNMSVEKTDKLNLLNTEYKTVVCVDGKYLAYGNLLCVEFDMQTKGMYYRGTNGVVCGDSFNGVAYLGSGKSVNKFETTDNADTSQCIVKLPYSDMGNTSDKQIRFLYFTGTLGTSTTFNVRNQFGVLASKVVTATGYVQNYKIEGLRLCKGPKLSVEIISDIGYFKLEELRAVYYPTSSRN